MDEVFEKYEALRAEIDERSKKLAAEHKNHMVCMAGCDLCCMDYSIFPIEFYYISKQINEMDSSPLRNKKAKKEDCIFLHQHRCSIYPERPIICRTHGLPLLYMEEDGNWQISACDLNFMTYNLNNITEVNTYAQDVYNSKLFILNKEFLASFKGHRYREFDLIAIRDLKDKIISET